MTKYATFGPDGILNGRYDSDINTVIPENAVPLTDQQFSQSITDQTGYLELIGGTITWTTRPVPQLPDSLPPSIITMRQARQALYQAGLLDQANSFIAAIPGSDGDKARIAWEYAGDVERANPLVAQIAASIGLTDQQLDDLFTLGASL
jgi:hypothetical protein